MLDFRKVLLAAAVAGLGLVSTASAQILTATTAPTNASGAAVYLPLESTTGQLGVVSQVFTSSTTGSVTVIINSNVPFTNVVPTTPSGNTNIDVSVTTDANAGTCAGPTVSTAGMVTLTAPTQITAVFTTVGATSTEFCVSGMRVNGSLAPATSAATVSFAGILGGGFSDSSTASLIAGYVYKMLATPAVTLAQSPNVTLCATSVAPVVSYLATTAEPVVSYTISSGFPGSLQTAAQVANGSTATPAPTATRLAVTFTNLNPVGVNYYVPTSITNAGLTMTAYTTATGTSAATAATLPAALTVLNGMAASEVLLTPSATGSATIYYGVTAGVGGAQSFALPLYEYIPSPNGVTSFATAPVGISVVPVNAGGVYAQYVSTPTPYVGTQVTTTATTEGLLTACSTTLLFPYVVNQSGFDTGIVITNASSALAAAGAGSGACSIAFFGTSAPTTAYLTPVLAAGSNSVFAASAQAPGLSGYAVATCYFTGAHGYAFVFSGAGMPSAYAADYLAVVLSSAGTPIANLQF